MTTYPEYVRSNPRPNRCSPHGLKWMRASVAPLARLSHSRGARQWRSAPSGQSAFTLIEIAIVVFILALVALLVTPKLHRFVGGDARSASRELAGLVASLVQEAVGSHTVHRLNYDLENHEYWVTTLTPVGGVLEEGPPIGSKRRLPSDVRFEDVVTAHQGQVTTGTAFTQFFPSGAVTRTTIHLRDVDDSQFTLSVNPVTGRVAVSDGYLEIREAS